jgi:hypothetical protein
VVYAGAREDLPLIGRDRALIADRKRRDHPAVPLGGQRREYPRAQGRAHASDPVLRPVHHRGEPPGSALGAHVARSAQISLEEPRFVVEAVGVRRTVRLPQSNRNLPAFSRRKIRDGRGLTLARGTTPPREHDVLWNDSLGGQHPLDVEFEAYAAFVRLRQARDHPFDPQVPAFPVGGQ